MTEKMLPFDVSLYDKVPISVFIYEPVSFDDGTEDDYRIVYGNHIFAKDWKKTHGSDPYIGAFMRGQKYLDRTTLETLDKFRTCTPYPFSAYIPPVDLHVHFEPLTDLPKPYAGFFVTNITGYQEKEAKVHFFRNARQINNIAVMMRIHGENNFESVFVTEAFANMMECTVDEAVSMMNGTGFLNSTVEEDRHQVLNMLKHRMSDDGTCDITIQKITAKKNIIWCKIHFAFIEDFGENLIYCTYSDVTTLKIYEERLRNVYNNLGRNFYRRSDDTLLLLRANLTRNVIEEIKGHDMPPAGHELSTYSDEIADHASHFPIAIEKERFLKSFDRMELIATHAQGNVSVTEVLYSQRPNGKFCFVNITAMLTRHPFTGDVIAFITQEECNGGKVHETMLSKILARQFDMVAYIVNGNYGVTIGNASNIKHGNIFPVSRTGSYEKYVSEQVLPPLVGDEEYRNTVKKAMSLSEIERNTRINEPYVVNIEIEIDGEKYNKRFDYYLVDPKADFYIVLKSDITEFHREQSQRNERLREALEEAKQANIAKTSFLSSMSHEIRTPLNSIIGIDNIALSDPELPDKTRMQFEKIGVSARHLLELINDILDMSRIESGRIALKNEEFSFAKLMDQINTVVAAQCQEKGLTYEAPVIGELCEYYIGDEMKLRQVMINILGNAIKFTPAPGKVTFTVEQTATFEDKSTLRFTITDTGIGMDEEYLPKIFDAFSQEESTATNSYGGSGLGMAITKNFIQMMNGHISVTSQKGVGTEFTVTVTLRNSERKDSGAIEELRPQDLKVLVIDDDPIDCEHARLVLEQIGITCDTASSGAEALKMMQVHHARRDMYDLVLVDLKMPELNGIEVTRKIRELYSKETTIIILTAYSWSDVEADAVKAGVDSFMSKPLSPQSVFDTFSHAIMSKKLTRHEKPKAELAGRRVLLAEDIEINAEIMKILLNNKQIEVEIAENGKIAVEMFERNPAKYYDAVLMDMRMPVMDGLTAAHTIRNTDHPDSLTIPIIALTANAFDEDVQRTLQSGMNAHLSKPVEPELLFDTLAGLIED